MEEVIATANVVFLAWAIAMSGSKSCTALPDYSLENQRLAEAIEEIETAQQKRGCVVVYVKPVR